MRVLAAAVISLGVALPLPAAIVQNLPSDVDQFLGTAGKFSAADRAALASGRVVTRVDPGTTNTEVLVTSAVKILAPRERTAEYYGQFTAYVDGKVTLGFGRLSEPPALDEVKALALDRAEIESIRTCRPGACDLRLPAMAIERLRSQIDWLAPDAAARVNERIRQAVVDYVTDYQKQGDDALVTYADRREPVSLRDQWRALLAASPVLHEYSPALAEYLAAFPRTPLAGARDVFYWVRENYGRKPVVSIVHTVVFDPPERADRTFIVQKQIYASHYYDGSLAVAAVIGAAESERAVTYLIYVNRSRGDLLNGGFGGLRRSIADDQARRAAQQTLTTMKTVLERN